MSINELKAVLSPPEHPVEVPTPAVWAAAEQSLGFRLPDDYKSFLMTYGTGRIAEFLSILNPAAATPTLNLLTNLPEQRKIVAYLRERGNVQVPYGILPEVPGLLPCGGTDNGDMIAWLVEGDDPNTWKTTLSAGRGEEFEVYDMNLTALLVQLLAGNFHSTVFPRDFPDERPRFEAHA